MAVSNERLRPWRASNSRHADAFVSFVQIHDLWERDNLHLALGGDFGSSRVSSK